MTRGSSYAFYAIGREARPAAEGTRRLRFRRCHWLQDVTRNDLWNKVRWAQVHGVGPGTGGYRLYDGSFFNGYDIPGDVEFDGCAVEHAFNGIHFFNEDLSGDRACDVHVHDCTFSNVRDNPIEPESRARNWWIHHNAFVDCHKWFSLELFRAGHFYIFANTGWFRSAPGAEPDLSGAVFKLLAHEDDIGRYDGPIHVFNNSWCLRSHLFKDGALARLRHHNNAIAFCQYLPGEKPSACGTGKPFGKHKEPRGTGAAPFFTKEWRKLDIAFTNDLVQHEAWPAELRHCGYHRLDGVHGAPMFADPLNGHFELLPDSPCRGAGVRLPVELPDGTVWTPPDHVPFNIGADQDDREVFKELTFRRLADRRGT
ncbi:MAG: hypothetical protein IPK81_16535 [Rhodospirillales bacterium]|nr:MAG: hypothetical protein IPK81_16535 [Rhodospirillales bacterium]